MRRFETEERAGKPPEFDPWLEELGMLADLEGEQAVLGVLLQFAPVECVRWLGSQQHLLAGLIARGRYGDRCRFAFGVYVGRGVGL
jgi:hypothetical protein